jgi:Activator of Hsp90 ATPase homolog 1-like protein
MIETVQAIRRHVVVQAAQRRAFEVFTAEMTSWWPADHHIGSAPIEEIIIEPHEGGRWYTRHQDGTETSTGYVAAWEPYDRVVLTWQIGADWKYDPKLRTSVHLRFIPEGPTGPGWSWSTATWRPTGPRRIACARYTRSRAHGTPHCALTRRSWTAADGPAFPSLGRSGIQLRSYGAA